MNKKIFVIIILILIFFIINTVTQNQIIKNIYIALLGENESDEKTLSYLAYDNQDINNVKILLQFNSEHGIEYIVKPDGEKIYGNLKNNVYLDYVIPMNAEENFLIKEKEKEEKTEILHVTQEGINTQVEVKSRTQADKDTVYSLGVKKQQNTDQLFFNTGEITDSWNTNINNIKLDLADVREFDAEDESYHKGKAKVNVKKVDKANNVLYATASCEVESTKYDIFKSIINTGKNLGNFIQQNTSNNEMASFTTYNLGIGHKTGETENCSGEYTLLIDNERIKKAQKISVEFMQRGYLGGYAQSSVEVYYKDGTSSVSKTPKYGGEWKSFTTDMGVDPNKEIECVKVKIWRV